MSGNAAPYTERFLGKAQLAVLRSAIGREIRSIYADHLHLDVETGRLQSWSLVLNALPETGHVVSLLTAWVQTGTDDFHALEVRETDKPFGIALTIDGGRVKSVGPCSAIDIGKRGLITAIDVVQYDLTALWADEPDEAEAVAETISYDRALVFRFGHGEPITLTTDHGSILGAFEIRTGVKPGFDYDEGKFSTRVTLN